MKKIQFGTGGFRGVIGDDFTKEKVQLIAQALANIIKDNQSTTPVVIGYDNRFMADFAAMWFANILNGNQIKVLLFTFSVPTPAVMSATRDLKNDFGVMITASHNPYYFNGIKIFTKDGYDADAEFTNLLEMKISEVKEMKTMCKNEARERGLLADYADTNSYISHIKSFIQVAPPQNRLKVLFNNMNGVGIIGLAPVVKKLKIHQFDVINADHDAFFGFNLPNPTKEALAGEFTETIKNQAYDLGMATDSDGDRLGVIDERGNYVSNNEIMACLYYYLVVDRGYQGDVVKNCATSILVDLTAEKLGYRCHEVDVGFKNITAAMKKHNALLGGESSGGLTARGYLYGKDAAFSGALFLEMVMKYQIPVSHMVQKLKDKVGYHYYFEEAFLPLREEPRAVIAYIAQNIPTFSEPLHRVDHFGNNFKFYFSNRTWMLIRLSGTEPALRIFAELKDEMTTKKAVNELLHYVEKVQKIVANKRS
ncbi:MAG: phosphoglucomutase/phosphomannomutase family protein [Bacilli bacterium]|jgi:phosphomannomutase